MEKHLGDVVKKHRLGTTINLFVSADASTKSFPSGFDEWRKRLEIKVVSPSKENKANIEVIKTISDFFDISYRNVSIINGKKNREKTVLIQGVNPNSVLGKLKGKI